MSELFASVGTVYNQVAFDKMSRKKREEQNNIKRNLSKHFLEFSFTVLAIVCKLACLILEAERECCLLHLRSMQLYLPIVAEMGNCKGFLLIVEGFPNRPRFWSE